MSMSVFWARGQDRVLYVADWGWTLLHDMEFVGVDQTVSDTGVGFSGACSIPKSSSSKLASW